MQNDFNAGNYAKLASYIDALKKYHPASDELIKAEELLEISQQKIKKEQAKRDAIARAEQEKKAAIAEAEKKARMKAVSKLKSKYDDVHDITWYYNQYFTHYNDINRTSLYIGKGEYSVWLRLKMSYQGSDWIFFTKAYLSYDGNTKQIPFEKYEDYKSNNSGGDVWEWIDVSVPDSDIEFLKKMLILKMLK